jgi:hypothetical protein
VADDRLHRLFSTLEASFDAALTAEEDEAARDLALSLRQGRDLRDLLRRSGPLALLTEGGGSSPVRALGQDFLVAGYDADLLVKFESAVLAQGTGTPPEQCEESWLETLREGARRSRVATVLLSLGGSYRGALTAVGPDHLAITTTMGELVIGLGAISSIRFEDRDDRA